jgi:hypothetical protein
MILLHVFVCDNLLHCLSFRTRQQLTAKLDAFRLACLRRELGAFLRCKDFDLVVGGGARRTVRLRLWTCS